MSSHLFSVFLLCFGKVSYDLLEPGDARERRLDRRRVRNRRGHGDVRVVGVANKVEGTYVCDIGGFIGLGDERTLVSDGSSSSGSA